MDSVDAMDTFSIRTPRSRTGWRRPRTGERLQFLWLIANCYLLLPGSSSAALVLPIARLALGQPLDRGFQAALAGFFCLGFYNPLHVVFLFAVGKALKDRVRLFVLLHEGHEIIGDLQVFLAGLRLWLGWVLHALVVELHSLSDVAQQYAPGREVLA